MDPVRGHAFLSSLAKADFLRKICQGLFCCLGKLSQFGVSAAQQGPHCSTPTSTGPTPCSEPYSSLQSHGALPCPGLPRQEKEQVQIQKQTPEPGLLHHHPVPKPVPLGRVQAG
ncbi:hypothetical protein DFAR_2950017 [Desulfarculales bacterium]